MKKPAPVASPGTVERFAGPMSALAGMMLVWRMVVRPCLRPLREQLHDLAGRFLRRHARRLVGVADPYLTVTVAEHDGEGMARGDVYEQARAYLSDRCARRARQLRAGIAPDSDRFVLSLGDYEEVADEFQGATMWWNSVPALPSGQKLDRDGDDGGRTYRLVFHKRHRELVVDSYLPHVCREGRAVMVANRRRKLFTNAGGLGYYGRSTIWRHVVLEHPSTFDTLAMDPVKKKEIMDDLDAFRNGKDYYKRVGKAWKRGYLLYGPPGTGKSTMIAAMANYLAYDIYDIELTSVYTNAELRRMFIDTSGKSIIVIEDIDCSLDLTGKRRKKPDGGTQGGNNGTKAASKRKKRPAPSEPDTTARKVTLFGLLNFVGGLWSDSAYGGERSKKQPLPLPGAAAAATDADATKRKSRHAHAPAPEPTEKNKTTVTLSGLLNFIDGLWSACGGERIIVFTTNHVEKLDPALIRRGRMDKHIEMSYCCFEAFKFLAKNYLGVDEHPLFDDVGALLQEVDITPADVAELLTPKRAGDDEETCLAGLVDALHKHKAKKKTGGASGSIQGEEEIVEDE